MKLQGLIKSVLCWVVLLAIGVVILEMMARCAIYLQTKRDYPYFFDNKQIVSPFKIRSTKDFDYVYKYTGFRPIAGAEFSDAQPIIIFGCSFAYGGGLDDDQTLSFKLSQQMKRTVYNRAIGGWGIQHMLYQLQNEPAASTIKEPKFIIYVFIDDHLRRMSAYINHPSDFLLEQRKYFIEPLRYQKERLQLVRKYDSIPILRKMALSALIMNKIDVDRAQWLYDKSRLPYNHKYVDLFKMHLLKSKKLVNKKWPNAKFIVLDYTASSNSSQYMCDPANQRLIGFWQDMKLNYGIEYIDVLKEFGVGSCYRKYTISDTDAHPNEHAWDVVVPQLVDRLKSLGK